MVGGEIYGGGGTSAAAPLWAALVARINQELATRGEERVGFLTSLLYTLDLDGSLTDIGGGYTGLDQACGGWDPCTGLGSPNGRKLLAALLDPGGGR